MKERKNASIYGELGKHDGILCLLAKFLVKGIENWSIGQAEGFSFVLYCLKLAVDKDFLVCLLLVHSIFKEFINAFSG